MPLSEQEQRLLDEMERNLYQNDADFVATVGGRKGKPNYRFVVIGVLVGVLGVATLVTGVITQLAVVGVIGFLIMFGGVLLAIAPPRSAPTAPSSRSSSSGARPKSSSQSGSRFMDSLNERWDRRNDERGQQ